MTMTMTTMTITKTMTTMTMTMTIRLQSAQSDCNLHNQTAISAIRLQSSQFDYDLHDQTAPQKSACNLSNKTAISVIRLQYQQTDCNLHNRTAISTIRLQCRRIAVWLLRLQSHCWDGCLIAEIAVWFCKWVKIRRPEIEASHWLRAKNRGLLLVGRTGFKKFKALAFCLEISLIPLIPDCIFHNQTAISAIRLQSSGIAVRLHQRWLQS